MSKSHTLQSLIADIIRVFHLWPFIAQTGIYNYFRHKKHPETLLYLDVVITECCTLKCRDCSNLMQYYHHPENLNVDETISSLRILLKSFKVNRLNLLGGEPFVCQENLAQILVFLNQEANDRVNEICIITNGTLIPSDKCFAAIKKNKKVTVVFSNYGELSSKQSEFLVLLKSNGIKYEIMEEDYWWDCGNLKPRDERESIIQHRYDACYTRRHCTTLFRGKLYVCPRQAHAVRLRVIPENDMEMVDILKMDQDDAVSIQTAVYRLLDRKERIAMCRLCGCNPDNKIPRAVQAERPIDDV